MELLTAIACEIVFFMAVLIFVARSFRKFEEDEEYAE
jgi:hypothetical protein